MNFVKIFFSLLILIGTANCDLKGVFTVIRHGNRGILKDHLFFCPKDGNLNDSDIFLRNWPNGLDEMTNKGLLDMFNVGKFLRNRYDEFIGDKMYNIYVRSTDTDRVLKSAQLVVNGIFKSKFNSSGDYLPIAPIHMVPGELDSLMFTFSNCPAAIKESQNLEIEMSKITDSKHQDLYNYLNDKCNVSHLTDWNKVSRLYDSFLIELDNNLKLPDFITQSVWNEMSEIFYSLFYQIGKTRKIQRLRTGLFLAEIVQKMEKLIEIGEVTRNGLEGNLRNFNIYMNSDLFQSLLLYALKCSNNIKHPPPFGSNIIFELHQNFNGSTMLNWVKIVYYNETNTNKTLELKIPECINSNQCEFEKFKGSIQDLLLDQNQWNKECELEIENLIENNYFKRMDTDSVLIIIILALVLVNSLIFGLMFFTKKQTIT